jgi:hypothetical protein
MIRKLIAINVCFALCAGCETVSQTRTSFSKWTRQSFDNLGIALELPDHAKNGCLGFYLDVADTMQYEQRTGRKDLIAYFHPVSSGIIGTEPVYLIKIRILVFQSKSNAEYRTTAFPKMNYPEMCSTNVIIFNRGAPVNCELYRKDVALADGRRVLCEAEIIEPDRSAHEYTADTNAIYRIFNSVSSPSH